MQGDELARRDHEAELRVAMSEALVAAEDQARRIGEDLHDGLCQELVGLARLTEGLAEDLPSVPVSIQERLNMIRAQALRLARVARSISHDLTLHELHVQSLPEALATLAERTEQMFQNTVEVNCGLEPGLLSDGHEEHVYRIVREAVTNALSHGQARRIWIDVVADASLVSVAVSNDGNPIGDLEQIGEGLGLRQMRMRARLLGGEFVLRRASGGQGEEGGITAAELLFPLPQGKEGS